MSWYRWDNDDLIFSVRVHPRASRDEISGVHDKSLKLQITASPTDGHANRHLIRFLAKAFGVSRSSVELLRGKKARDKQLRIRSPKKIPEPLATILNRAR